MGRCEDSIEWLLEIEHRARQVLADEVAVEDWEAVERRIPDRLSRS